MDANPFSSACGNPDKPDSSEPGVKGAVPENRQNPCENTGTPDDRQEADRMKAIIDAIPTPVWSAGSDGVPDFLNKAWLDFAGEATQDELLDGGWVRLIHPEDRQPAADAWNKIIHDGRTEDAMIVRYRRFDGLYRWFLVRISAVQDAQGNIERWYGANVDIEDFKQSEEALRKEKDLFGTTVSATAEGILVTDGEARIILMNPAAEQIMGLAPAALLGKPLGEVFVLMDDRTAERLPDKAGKVLHEQVRVEFPDPLRLLREDGSDILVTGTMAPIPRQGFFSAGIVVSFRDVSREFMLEKEIEGFLNVNLDMLCVGDLDGNFVKINRKFEEVLGYSTDELEGRNFMQFIHPDDVKATLDALVRMGEGSTLTGFINRYLCKDGSYKFIEWNSIPGVGRYVYTSARDVTDKIRLQEKLKALATQDELTGLYNRHHFDTVINDMIERADRYEEPLSLFIFDLDHFKRVNDTFGHPAGDVVLRTISATAARTLREADLLFRFGGEEFLVLMPQTALPGAAAAADKLRCAVETELFPAVGHLTVSIGVSERMKSESFRHWFRRTDDALYKAKHAGRNCVVASDGTEMMSSASLKLEWRTDLNSGNELIDHQHRELFEIGNSLIGALLAGREETGLMQDIELLMLHLGIHFECEERIIEKAGYPGFQRHAQIHRDLIAKAQRLMKGCVAGEIRPSAFFSFIVDDVVLDHMTAEDTKFFDVLSKAASNRSSIENH